MKQKKNLPNEVLSAESHVLPVFLTHLKPNFIRLKKIRKKEGFKEKFQQYAKFPLIELKSINDIFSNDITLNKGENPSKYALMKKPLMMDRLLDLSINNIRTPISLLQPENSNNIVSYNNNNNNSSSFNEGNTVSIIENNNKPYITYTNVINSSIKARNHQFKEDKEVNQSKIISPKRYSYNTNNGNPMTSSEFHAYIQNFKSNIESNSLVINKALSCESNEYIDPKQIYKDLRLPSYKVKKVGKLSVNASMDLDHQMTTTNNDMSNDQLRTRRKLDYTQIKIIETEESNIDDIMEMSSYLKPSSNRLIANANGSGNVNVNGSNNTNFDDSMQKYIKKIISNPTKGINSKKSFDVLNLQDRYSKYNNKEMPSLRKHSMPNVARNNNTNNSSRTEIIPMQYIHSADNTTSNVEENENVLRMKSNIKERMLIGDDRRSSAPDLDMDNTIHNLYTIKHPMNTGKYLEVISPTSQRLHAMIKKKRIHRQPNPLQKRSRIGSNNQYPINEFIHDIHEDSMNLSLITRLADKPDMKTPQSMNASGMLLNESFNDIGNESEISPYPRKKHENLPRSSFRRSNHRRKNISDGNIIIKKAGITSFSGEKPGHSPRSFQPYRKISSIKDKGIKLNEVESSMLILDKSVKYLPIGDIYGSDGGNNQHANKVRVSMANRSPGNGNNNSLSKKINKYLDDIDQNNIEGWESNTRYSSHSLLET